MEILTNCLKIKSHKDLVKIQTETDLRPNLVTFVMSFEFPKHLFSKTPAVLI